MSTRRPSAPITSLLIAVAALFSSVCDEGSSMADGDGEEIRTTGVVANDATAAKAEGEVDDADINARETGQDGGTSTADGETTTDSRGRYGLAAPSRSILKLVTATGRGSKTSADSF